jgi:hypothetical protein
VRARAPPKQIRRDVGVCRCLDISTSLVECIAELATAQSRGSSGLYSNYIATIVQLPADPG